MPFKMNFRAPMQRMASRIPMPAPPQGGLGVAMGYPPAPMLMPAPEPRAVASPGGGGGFDERTGTYTRPPRIFDRLFGRPRIDFETGQPLPPSASVGFGQAMGSGLGGMLGGMTQQPMMGDRPVMPEPAAPSLDPNRALNDYNRMIGDMYRGGVQMDMNMIREQQAALRNLQLNQNATAKQHDVAYGNALAALRAKYPDAFGS